MGDIREVVGEGEAMEKVKGSLPGEVWVLMNDKDNEGMECFECGKVIAVGEVVVWCRRCYQTYDRGVCVAHVGCGLLCGEV